jgi:hypothetical protein
MEHACGFDRSELYSDEGPPIGAVAIESWAETSSEITAWVLRWVELLFARNPLLHFACTKLQQTGFPRP